MDVRQYNKMTQVRSGWARELSAVSCRTSRGFPGTAGLAKQCTNRAQRRIDSFLVEEGIDEYLAEEQEAFDAIWRAELTRDLEEAYEDERRFGTIQEPDLDLLMHVFAHEHEYIWDGNGPGVVYYSPPGMGRRCCDALRNQGCVPILADQNGALKLVIEGHARMDTYEPWYLCEAPKWWYESKEEEHG